MGMQMALDTVFPPDCLCCGERVAEAYALCPDCWADTSFVMGASCDLCGVSLPGSEPEEGLLCDECMAQSRPWDHGRTVFGYGGAGRRLVLALKHGDKPEIARAAGKWMARAAADLIQPDSVIVPVPLHWWRLFRRRFNQSALLAQALANESQAFFAPDALRRVRKTPSQDGLGREARFENLRGAIEPHPRKGYILAERPVVLVDDVMTSGATLAAAAEACREVGAENISVITLARVHRDT